MERFGIVTNCYRLS